jgi:hypothetical protein
MIKKVITLGVSAVLATALTVACKEKVPNVAPEPDTETETAVDAAWATFVMTDIDMVVSFIAENDLFPKFYTHVPGTETANGGTVSAQREPGPKQLNINFNNAKCMDGRMRKGEIFIEYKYEDINHQGGNPNSNYYHEYGFACKVSLNDYRVDGWLIDEYNPSFPAYIYNELTGHKTGQMRWRIAGKIRMLNPADPKKNIIWDGKIYKTLVNANESSVLSYTRGAGIPVITWTNAICSYSGTVDGATHATRDTLTNELTSQGVSFRMKIDQNDQLIRDFKCYPDKVAAISLTSTGVNTYSMKPQYEEFHPFKSGIASFTTSTKYPRQIYFGNEGSPDLGAQCDNTGEVLIKGISYKVNFRK